LGGRNVQKPQAQSAFDFKFDTSASAPVGKLLDLDSGATVQTDLLDCEATVEAEVG
jgi:hypothetical protein